jgi:hypothetical protein
MPVRVGGLGARTDGDWLLGKDDGLGRSFRASTLSGGVKVDGYREGAKVRDARLKDKVPPSYVGLEIDADGVLVKVTSLKSVEKVLGALDPDSVLRYGDEPLDPQLVGLLALPVQFALEAGKKGAQVGVIRAEDVAKLNSELGAEIAQMQQQSKQPKVYKEYLPRLMDAWKRSQGNGSSSAKGSGSTSGTGPSEPEKKTTTTDPNAVVIRQVSNEVNAGMRVGGRVAEQVVPKGNGQIARGVWKSLPAYVWRYLGAVKV